jgi:FkbM family methyltransferase
VNHLICIQSLLILVNVFILSSYLGQAKFKKCNTGNEVCSLDVSNTTQNQQVQVDVITLDAFSVKHNLSMIDIIKIDTEGYESLVFEGMKNLLQQHRVRLFLFEYLRSKLSCAIQCIEQFYSY